jgi:hypothetical protein
VVGPAAAAAVTLLLHAQADQPALLRAAAGSGTIDVKELKDALTAMGHTPCDEELFAIVHEVRVWACFIDMPGDRSHNKGRGGRAVAPTDRCRTAPARPRRWTQTTRGR